MTFQEGKTALFHGVEKGHVGVVRELLLVGANTEVTNKVRESLKLHHELMNRVVSLLLKASKALLNEMLKEFIAII